MVETERVSFTLGRVILSELEVRVLLSFPLLIAGGRGDLSLGEDGEVGFVLVVVVVRGGGGGGDGVLGAIFVKELRRSNDLGPTSRLQVGCRTALAEVEEMSLVSRGHIFLVM